MSRTWLPGRPRTDSLPGWRSSAELRALAAAFLLPQARIWCAKADHEYLGNLASEAAWCDGLDAEGLALVKAQHDGIKSLAGQRRPTSRTDDFRLTGKVEVPRAAGHTPGHQIVSGVAVPERLRIAPCAIGSGVTLRAVSHRRRNVVLSES
jgi:hypothetical protein